jgi:hypothetical protein
VSDIRANTIWLGRVGLGFAGNGRNEGLKFDVMQGSSVDAVVLTLWRVAIGLCWMKPSPSSPPVTTEGE